MLFKPFKIYLIFVFAICQTFCLSAQQALTLKQAVSTSLENYGTLRAKASYAAASKAAVEFAKSEYLPNLNVAGQWDYGTVNGQIGPAYGFGGLGVASSGLPSPNQNWNAAFGAIYLTNVNWEFFAFGRVRERIKVSETLANRDQLDLEQEKFQQSIKVAAAYLNLLVAQRLTRSYERNLNRAEIIGNVVVNRARNGLIAGVDSSLANAEISNARIAITRARDFEQEQENKLAVLMGVTPQRFVLDTLFVAQTPIGISEIENAPQSHPILQYYKSRIATSEEQVRYFKTLYYPSFSLVGIFQTRGSGFGSTYASNQTDFTHDVIQGFKPVRSNYLLGLGVTWNLTQPFRYSRQIKSQGLISKGLQEEYNLVTQQLDAQLSLAENKIKNALESYREAPVQVRAAEDAFRQKSALYRGGLTNLVDMNQALYALVRAETDKEISGNNVWQGLLLKAAAAGDFSIFDKGIE